WDGGLAYRLSDSDVIINRQFILTPTAANQRDHLNFIIPVEPLDSLRDLVRSLKTLHAHILDLNDPGAAFFAVGVLKIMERVTVSAGDNTDALDNGGQRSPLRRPAAHLRKLLLHSSVHDISIVINQPYLFYINLHFGCFIVHTHAAKDFEFHTVADLEVNNAAPPFVEHTGDGKAFVGQVEINVTEVGDEIARDDTIDPKGIAQRFLLHQRAHHAVDLVDGAPVFAR